MWEGIEPPHLLTLGASDAIPSSLHRSRCFRPQLAAARRYATTAPGHLGKYARIMFSQMLNQSERLLQ